MDLFDRFNTQSERKIQDFQYKIIKKNARKNRQLLNGLK